MVTPSPPAVELVAGMKAGSLRAWRTGIRVKSMSAIERERSVRTLRLFLCVTDRRSEGDDPRRKFHR